MTDSGYKIEGGDPAAMNEATPGLAASGGHSASLSPMFQRDKFLLHQKRIAISEKYYVYDERGDQVMFVHRKAHHLRTILAALAVIAIVLFMLAIGVVVITMIDEASQNGISDALLAGITIPMLLFTVAIALGVGVWISPKRHITYYGDESMSVPILNVFQDSKWQIPIATYTVADPDLNMIGFCRKNYLHNIIRKKWQCYDPQGALVFIAYEDSIIKAVLRRFLGTFYGLLRTNFVILAPDQRTKLGTFNRKFTLFDKYVLDMTPDATRRLDRRLAVAIGVLLDTGERR